jgi:hypothetical protein
MVFWLFYFEKRTEFKMKKSIDGSIAIGNIGHGWFDLKPNSITNLPRRKEHGKTNHQL